MKQIVPRSYTDELDEPTYVTLPLQILKTGDVNLHGWHYTSLLFYLNAAAFWLSLVVGRFLGWIAFAAPAGFPLPEVVSGKYPIELGVRISLLDAIAAQ